MITTTTQFELWRSIENNETTCLSLFRTGKKGDQARSMLPPNSEIIHIIDGVSHIDVMNQYYALMDWGEYHALWPHLDNIPIFFNDAIEVLKTLPKSIKPLQEIEIYADGHSEPALPGSIPLIKIQDKAVFSVGVHIFGDFGGYAEEPLNVVDLMAEANLLVRNTRPNLLDAVQSKFLVCPIELAEKMLWIPEEKIHE
jgi:hypothetical protein